MNIAFIAHDRRKELIVQFCSAYCGIFAKHKLCATAVTGKLIADATGLEIYRFMGGADGGDQQMASRIANSEIDLFFFFRDPSGAENANFDSATLMRLCDVHNVPMATNIASAKILVHALDNGDLEWQEPLSASARRKRTVY